MRKFQLEMGGKNPLVVLDDADLKAAVECARQRCVLLHRAALHGVEPGLIVTEGIHDSSWAAVERIKTLVVDDALKHGTDIGPVVDEKQLDQDLMYIEIGRKEGAKLAWGGERLNRETPASTCSRRSSPRRNDMRINREEIFGPVASGDPGQELRRGAGGRQRHAVRPLVGHLHDQPQTRDRLQRKNSAAGMVMVNLPTAGVDYHAPVRRQEGLLLRRASRGATPWSSIRR